MGGDAEKKMPHYKELASFRWPEELLFLGGVSKGFRGKFKV
jgi:hypothetical protein